MIQWLRLLTPSAGGLGSIPGWGIKIPHAKQWDQKKKKKEIISGDSWKATAFFLKTDIWSEKDSPWALKSPTSSHAILFLSVCVVATWFSFSSSNTPSLFISGPLHLLFPLAQIITCLVSSHLSSFSWNITFQRPLPTTPSEKALIRDFPGGPVARTLSSQCRGPGFNPYAGN